MSDLLGNGELILDSAYASPNIGSPLPNKADIGKQPTMCTFQIFFGRGVSGSKDRDGGDNSIQFINFGKVGDKK